jgi:serine/threonine protein kinase
MDFTVENICGFLIRGRLLTPEEVKTMYQRWLGDCKDGAGNLAKFSQWLVANKYVTEYQAALLIKGHADDFFLNQYQILERLGRGRMAGVYKAVHHLGQVVAVKVLPPSRAKNAYLLSRFQREARLGMRLKHPNVVRSFQVGEDRGLNYLVMEYLEGETLDDVLQRRKRLPPNEAVRLVHQALLGLQHIHEQGMIHRDLKPANLMLVPGPGRSDDTTLNATTLNATVKILDIGLGREMFEEGGQPPPDSELTGEGVLLGTPDYLAPEQARDPRSIDIRADIYSLGCVLYHTLTGQPPFPDKNLMSQIVRHATEAPEPLKEFNPAIPDGLQQIVNWMLAKKPEERYATPERAAQALQVFLVAEAEGNRGAGEAPEMRKFLTWLETGSEREPGGPTPIIPAAFAVPVEHPVASTPGTAATVTLPPPAAIPIAAVPLPAGAGSAAAPVAQLVPPTVPAKPAVATAPLPGERHQRSAKKNKHQRKHERPPASPKRVAQPAPLVAAPAPAANAVMDIDVELVTVPDSKPAARGFSLSRRDWILLGVGAGSVIFAGLLGMVLALIFRS